MKLNGSNFFDLSRKAIEQREYSKFVFTKYINEIFNNLIKLGHEIGVSRQDLEYIDINSILKSYGNLNPVKLKKILKNEISNNKKNYKILENIKLPSVILKSKEVYYFGQEHQKGNFINNVNTIGEIKYLKKLSDMDEIANKIVLIENADPGFDIIFSKKIKGLITKYGGSYSHMAIRCLELGIPAVIGIGLKEFEKILKVKKIEIDFKIQKINFI